MKTNQALIFAIGIGLLFLRGHANGIASADYSIISDNVNSGGTVLGSSDYSIVSTTGGIGGSSSETTSGYLVKNGFPGQIYNVSGVIPTVATSTVNEGTTLQLGISQVLDDSTFLVLSPSEASWSVASGPISGITASGLATAAIVYQDTVATISSSWRTFTGSINLTVLNVNTDDYGDYSGDGLPDDWQSQYFGLNNPNSAPTKDVTGSGQNNWFKYVAGLDPTDRASVFRVNVHSGIGQSNQIVFGPLSPGRTYAVYYKSSMSDTVWTELTGMSQNDTGSQRTITDTSAGTQRFYRVQISKP